MTKEHFIKKFDEFFRTEFHKKDKKEFNLLVKSKKKELGLLNLKSDNYLIILCYLYLESKNFSIDNEKTLNEFRKQDFQIVKKVFLKPLICQPKNKDFVIVIHKKIKGDINPENLFKDVKAYNGCDIIYLNKKTKKLVFTYGNATQKVKKLEKEKKLSFLVSPPKKISFDPFEKILSSKKLDIFEVEFRSLNFQKVKGFYIKAGSKEDKINSKVNEIRKRLLKKDILRVSNIKKIHLALKGEGRDKSSSLILTPKSFGIYRIKWKGKSSPELNNFIKEEVLKGFLNVDLVDKDVPLSERLIENFFNRGIFLNQYESGIKSELKKWDRYKLIKYEGNRLKPDYKKFETLLISTLKKDYDINRVEIDILKNIKKKGFLLKNKNSGKEIFIFLNKRGTKSKDIDLLMRNKRPILILDFYEMINQIKRYNFLYINEKGIKDFKDNINKICNYPEFYELQYQNFLESGEKLKEIGKLLRKFKTNQGKGAFWERICGDILSFIFNRTFILSGPSLPDGLTYWAENGDGFLWDSKALFTKKLKESIKGKKNKPKDIAYTDVFRKKIKINYYIFLTCSVSKDSFLEAQEILKKYKKNIKFVCLTDKALLDLKNYFEKQNYSDIFHKNLRGFSDNLKSIFKDKEYIDSISFNDIAKNVIIKSDFDLKKIRSEVKEKMNS